MSSVSQRSPTRALIEATLLVRRSEWIAELERHVEPGCEIGMEACGGAHHWARLLQSKGYVVKLIAPQFVKPYVKSNKNDANDAQAICEAMSRPSMRYVAVKTVEQQDIQAVHRVRAGLIGERTAKANQLRGLVYGHSARERERRQQRSLLDPKRKYRLPGSGHRDRPKRTVPPAAPARARPAANEAGGFEEFQSTASAAAASSPSRRIAPSPR
jgi:transposase